MMNNALVAQGQWWRVFTAIFLHADIAHLVSNVVFGVIVLGLAMARFGAGLGLLGAFSAGAVGNILGYLFYNEAHRGLGASGMMMGALGLVTLHYLAFWRQHPRATRLALKAILAGAAIFLMFGVDPTSDVLAHLGGFVAGALIGGVLSFISHDKAPPKWLNAMALITFIGLAILSWSLAVGLARHV